jgi:branched-chain amino acid transport system permease protein
MIRHRLLISRKYSLVIFPAAFAFLLWIPSHLSSYLLHVAIMILFFGFLGSAWNILGGYAGQHSFGHSAFFGIGAYVSTLLYIRNGVSPWVGMLLGASLAAAVGACIGYLTFRYKLRGAFFALGTFAISEMFRIVALNWDITEKAMGLLIPLRAEDSYADFLFNGKAPYYYIILLMVVFILLVSYALENSKLGYYLKAIREDQEAAGSLGINILKYKTIALTISAFLTALGGTFYAQYMYYIDPDIAFGIDMTIEMIVRPIFGGLGTLFGPLLGSGILEGMTELMRNMLGEFKGLHVMFYGAILIVVIMYFPDGLMGLIKKKVNRPREVLEATSEIA